MIITESRYRVLVKVPAGVNVEAYTDELFMSASSDWGIEEIERYPLCAGGTEVLVYTEVMIYPYQDTSIHCARMLEKLAHDTAAAMGFILMPIEK